jgi:predicted permease
VQYLIQPLPSIFPPEAEIALNLPVLIFSIGISVLTGIVCGLWPAMRLSRADLRQAFDDCAHKLAGRRGTRSAHTVLLAAQVALTILLLACSGATVRRLSQLVHADLGYEPQDLSTVNLVLHEGSHDQWASRVAYFEQIREAIANDPDVVSAAIGNLPPTIIDSTPVGVPALKATSGQVVAQQVSPEYFSTLRIPLLLGRVWTAAETAHAAHLALINDAMRRRYWPHDDPLGQTLVLNNGVANGNVWKLVAPGNDQHFLIIGVVGDAPNRGLGDEVSPGVYVPFTMTPFDGFNVVVRTRGNSSGLLHAIKEHVHSVDPGQAVGDLRTATDLLEGDSLGRERFVARLFSGFAFLGLAFAVSGLYSIQSYLVAQRTRELGLRIALGAQRSHILDEVTRASALSVLGGTGIGIVLNLALSQVFSHWTNGNARDPEMLVAIVALLLFAAALASVGPALVATSIAPTDALRAE